MFELGLRLAFDKPTIIIKDETTGDSFDTAPIERLEYSRSLHYPSVVRFKKKLKEKILATMDKAEKDENYSPFLRNFGELVPAKISKQEVSQQQFWDKKVQGLDEKLDLVLKRLARQNQETDAGVWRKIQSDKEGEVWAQRKRAMPIGLGGMKGFGDAKRHSLLQKLRQAHEELRLVNSAAAASKQTEIERLEKDLYGWLKEDQE